MIAYVNRPWFVIRDAARDRYIDGSLPGVQTALFLTEEDCRLLASGVVSEDIKSALAFAAYPEAR